MSKRLGIFVFYDPEGYVGEYIEYLLEEIKSQLEDLVIVCNGILSGDGRKIFEKYTRQIIIRANIGFDAGAYKEVIKKIYDDGSIYDYDQLLLFNDTFFGPFYSFQDIFHRMEDRNVDFWGLTWHQSEYIPPHIQTYFMNFGLRVIRSRLLYDFFEEIDTNTQDVLSVVSHMEIILTEYLKKKGFVCATYVEKSVGARLNYYPYEFLVNDNLPILKIKSFGLCPEVDSEIKKCLDHLRKNNMYDINLLEKQVWHRFRRKISEYQENVWKDNVLPVPTTDLEGIKRFSDSCQGVYLFGAGFYGSVIMRYIGKENVKGYIVSDDYYKVETYEGVKVYRISQIDDKGVGIVVAVKAGYTREVSMKLEGFYNVLYLWE